MANTTLSHLSKTSSQLVGKVASSEAFELLSFACVICGENQRQTESEGLQVFSMPRYPSWMYLIP